MNKTGIEYLTHTWNPIAMRCTPISEACDNCWHLRIADRLAKNPKIEKHIRDRLSGKLPPILVRHRLNKPSRLKKSAIIGVQFMGDLAHTDIQIEQFAAVIDQIVKCPQHTFLILTKRPANLQYFMSEYAHFNYGVIKNLWVGVTVELQKHDHRIATLLKIPARVHFVSIEPMLGPLTFNHHWLGCCEKGGPCGDHAFLKWVICGAETGSKRRFMNLQWVRSVRDQCTEVGIPFFFKKQSCGSRMLDQKLWGEFPKNRR